MSGPYCKPQGEQIVSADVRDLASIALMLKRFESERDKARAEVKQLTEEKRAMAKMIASECADPNGTIWDLADRLRADLDRRGRMA
jgi:hypothetical protein